MRERENAQLNCPSPHQCWNFALFLSSYSIFLSPPLYIFFFLATHNRLILQSKLVGASVVLPTKYFSTYCTVILSILYLPLSFITCHYSSSSALHMFCHLFHCCCYLQFFSLMNTASANTQCIKCFKDCCVAVIIPLLLLLLLFSYLSLPPHFMPNPQHRDTHKRTHSTNLIISLHFAELTPAAGLISNW